MFATRVNWFHECRNKCFINSRVLSVNTLIHNKPHGIDMETRHVLTTDSDKEINNDDGAETQYSAHPELQAPASASEQGQDSSGSSCRVDRSLPRNTYPPEIESEFVGQVGFLDSKTGQLERSLAPGSQSSPAARLARHSQQQQQGPCSAVTASPLVGGSERSLFNVDLNPYISPVITNNLGLSQTDRQVPTRDAPATWGLDNVGPRHGPGQIPTRGSRTWGQEDTSSRYVIKQADENPTRGDPITWGPESAQCTSHSALQSNFSVTDCYDRQRDEQIDEPLDLSARKNVHGSLERGSGFYTNIVDESGCAIINQASAGTALPIPDRGSQRSLSDADYVRLDSEIQVRGRELAAPCRADAERWEKLQNEMDSIRDELKSIKFTGRQLAVCDTHADTLSLVNPDDVIKPAIQNSDPPGTVTNDTRTAGRRPFVNTPPTGQRDWFSTSSDDSSFSPQRRARSLGARPTQPTFPLGDPPAICRVSDKTRYVQSALTDKMDAMVPPTQIQSHAGFGVGHDVPQGQADGAIWQPCGSMSMRAPNVNDIDISNDGVKLTLDQLMTVINPHPNKGGSGQTPPHIYMLKKFVSSYFSNCFCDFVSILQSKIRALEETNWFYD